MAEWITALRGDTERTLTAAAPPPTHDPYRHPLTMRTPQKIRPFSFLHYQAGWRKVEKGRWWERRRAEAEGSAEALAVRVAQRGHEVSEQYCSQLELGFEASKALARRTPQASSSKHIVSTIPAFPLCFGAG